MNFKIEEFIADYNLEMIYFYQEDNLCFNIYDGLEKINIAFKMAMKLQECYKTIINTFYDLEPFLAQDAKFFEKCVQSSKEDITMYELEQEELNAYQLGDIDSNLRLGLNCTPKDTFLTTMGTTLLAKQLVRNVGSYLSRAQFFNQETSVSSETSYLIL